MTIVPERLASACRGVPERMAWLEQLPNVIQELQDRWGLSLGEPWSSEASCSWVAPAVRKDGTPVVMKLGMPHMEAAHEIDGLRFWDGEPTVRLLEADADLTRYCSSGATRAPHSMICRMRKLMSYSPTCSIGSGADLRARTRFVRCR